MKNDCSCDEKPISLFCKNNSVKWIEMGPLYKNEQGKKFVKCEKWGNHVNYI